ncbi:MAG TPA: protein kinase [Polyangiaceae bacterium]|nr:protein kinase [Polyangiaceae bacterium]
MAASDLNDSQGTLLGLQGEQLPPPATAPPARKYHPLMELGRGGSAVVSAALARGIGGFSKIVVLKTTKEELSGRAEAVKASLNEARLAARMNHPNIVQVYEVYQDLEAPVIVMEYLDGLSLSRVVRRTSLAAGYTVELALSVLCKVLEGIRYAHELCDFDGKPLGIVHRDISPQNVMLTYDGQVKLVDFGTAKLTDVEQTLSGALRGKIGYMPPEQLLAQDVDGRADLFAVGVMVWEAAAGTRMWGDLNHAGIVGRLMERDIPPLSAAAPGVDPELERICSRALAPNRDHRYSTAGEFLTDLERYLQGRGGVATAAAVADVVNKSCVDLKRAQQQALRVALAKEQNWQLDAMRQTGECTATLHPLEGSAEIAAYELQELRKGRRERKPVLAALLAGGVLGGVLLTMYAARSPEVSVVPERAPTALAAPSAEARLVAAVSAPALPLEPSAYPLAMDPEPAPAAGAVEKPGAVSPAGPTSAAKRSATQRATESTSPRGRSTPRPRGRAAGAEPCDPPYSIDVHGIKRFRRECLAGKP